MNIDWNAILITAIPGAVLSILGYWLGKRERNKKIQSSIVDDVQKITDIQETILKNSEEYWRKRSEDREKDCHEEKEKLRQKTAELLVENADLKTKNAEQQGYINGLTNPLVKLEEKQKQELRQGRRATD